MRKSYRNITETRHQENEENKATSSLFPIMIIAKLERIQSIAQQTMEQTQNPTMGAAINNNSNNNNRTTALEGTAAYATGGFIVFY